MSKWEGRLPRNHLLRMEGMAGEKSPTIPNIQNKLLLSFPVPFSNIPGLIAPGADLITL